jgi:hypothetical protein
VATLTSFELHVPYAEYYPFALPTLSSFPNSRRGAVFYQGILESSESFSLGGIPGFQSQKNKKANI